MAMGPIPVTVLPTTPTSFKPHQQPLLTNKEAEECGRARPGYITRFERLVRQEQIYLVG